MSTPMEQQQHQPSQSQLQPLPPAPIHIHDIVQYLCCCGSLKSIGFTYFCRHCLRLRCHYCVSHEVDSHFCGNCSENMPSAEAKQKKNRCNTCWDCPSCKLTLSIRAITTHEPSKDDPALVESKKFYFLACNYCRWTSRDAGIPDATSSNGPWKEAENVHNENLDKIAEYFRLLAQREKSLEKKYVPNSKFLEARKHGLAHLLPKRLPGSGQEEILKALPPPTYIAPTVGLEDLEDETEDFYNEETDVPIPQITTLSQRLSQIEIQPRLESQLLPSRKHLMIKRSLRCRVCERNIHRPEYSPASIKFKIQCNAYYHVPQITVLPISLNPQNLQLQPGQKTKLHLRISNPLQFPTTVKFLPFSFVPLKKNGSDGLIQGLEALGTESTTDSLPLSLTSTSNPQQQIVKEISVLPINEQNYSLINCKLIPIENVLILPPRDETSDFDDMSDAPDYNDDINFIPWRKANKANVQLEIERLNAGNGDEPLALGLTIEYDYTNTIVTPDKSSGFSGPQKVRIQTHCLITLN